MALNTVAAGRAWLYSHNIGRNAQAGMGFSNPVGVGIADGGVLFVANRSGEQNPSSRISKITIDQEFISEFGRTGPAYGGGGSNHFTWITGVALDSDGNVFASDEWKSQISSFDSDGNLYFAPLLPYEDVVMISVDPDTGARRWAIAGTKLSRKRWKRA